MTDEKKVYQARAMALFQDLDKITNIVEKSIRKGRLAQRDAALIWVYADNAQTKLKQLEKVT